jgi:predicted HD phosphohydrolase
MSSPSWTGISTVCELLATAGQERCDEDVTQLDHALQAAALAEADGASDVLIVAALLHDIGHLVSPDLDHETVGARFLGPPFGSAVAGPVALHVQAKRYLVTVDPAYQETLSDASRQSLAAQGGPLSLAEAARFARLPAAGAAIRLRRWDDLAKVPGRLAPDLSHWRHYFVSVLARRMHTMKVVRPPSL